MIVRNHLDIPSDGLFPASSFMSYDTTKPICYCAMPGTKHARSRGWAYQAREWHRNTLFEAVVGSHAGQIRCSIPSKLDY